MENLYKVVITVSHGNSDGTCETGRDTYTKYFERKDEAIRFATDKPGIKTTFFDETSCEIYEYAISSVRELKQKTRPVEVVTKTETYWD